MTNSSKNMGKRAMAVVFLLTIALVSFPVSKLYAVAIVDVKSDIAGWTFIGSEGATVTVSDLNSVSSTYGYSPISGSHGDYEALTGIVNTDALSGVSEATGKDLEKAKTTSTANISTSVHSDSHGEYYRYGSAFAQQYGAFTVSGNGQVRINFDYYLWGKASTDYIDEYAYGWSEVYTYLYLYDPNGSDYFYKQRYINVYNNQVASLYGEVNLLTSVSDGAYGYFYVESESWGETFSEHPRVPEPNTMFLLGSLATGLFGFAGLRRRFTK